MEEDAEAAVALSEATVEAAVEATLEGHPNQATHLTNLGAQSTGLNLRIYLRGQYGQAASLEAAIAHLEAAVRNTRGSPWPGRTVEQFSGC